jgi:hypothetical protein
MLRKAFLIEDTLKELTTSILETFDRKRLNVDKIIGKDVLTIHDLGKLDFIKLSEQGVLEKLKKTSIKWLKPIILLSLKRCDYE